MKKVIFTLVLALSGSTGRTAILDQSQEQLGGVGLVISPDWSIAQTFTAGITGQLEKVDLYLENDIGFNDPPDLYPTTVSIVSVINEVPSGPVLGTVYAEDLAEGFNSINFLPESVFLVANDQYGIVLFNDDPDHYNGPSTQWRGTGDVYSAGSLWSYVFGEWTQTVTPPGDLPVETFYDKDAVFRTYMVPEPATLILFTIGGLFLRKRSR